MKQLFIKMFGVILVLTLSFWAVKPLFAGEFFPMHDDTQVARVFEMGKALKDGMFPVRWVPDLGYGYGYPIFNFYAPLAYYFGGLLTLLGFDALVATKIMMIVGILLSGIFMYLLAKEFWGKIGGIVSSLFYVYAPYHALDIYVRGDVAETWAYAFIPLMFFGFYKVFSASLSNYDSRLRWMAVGSIGYGGIILSHNLTALMVTPFLLIATLFNCYIAYRRKKLFTIYYLLFTILLGLALSAFYWIPAFLEMKYTNVLSQIGGGADFRDHFVCVEQLWNSQWGFGGSIPGCVDGLSFKIGKLHIFAVLTSLLIMLLSRMGFTPHPNAPFVRTRVHGKARSEILKCPDRKSSTKLVLDKVVGAGFTKSILNHSNNIYHYSDRTTIVWFFISGSLIVFVLMLAISKPLWEIIPLMKFFQYPWRFLLLMSFFSSVLAGFCMWILQRLLKLKKFNTVQYLSAAFLIFWLLYFNSKFFQPQTTILKAAEDYTNERSLKWIASKISDEYMPANFVKPKSFNRIVKDKLVILSQESEIVYKSQKTQKLETVIDVKREAEIQTKTAYFPAWNVFLDGKKVLYTISDNGLMVLLPEGRHSLDIEFIQTPIEKIANSMSLISLIVLFTGIIFTRKFHYE